MVTPIRNSHCNFCGHTYEPNQPWPRQCASCGRTTYLNPLPVAVILVPVEAGLMLIRRGVAPAIGKLALPGGYVGQGETWQAAGAREVWEETGLTLDPAQIEDFRVLSAPDNTILIFGIARSHAAAELPVFVPTNETSERVIIYTPQELAFGLHEQVVREFFGKQR